MPAGALVEFRSHDVVRNQPDLVEVFGQGVRASCGEVPFDARLFGLDGNAERDLLGFGLGQRVGHELIGERRLVVFAVGTGRLKVDHGQAVFDLPHEVDDADEGGVQRGDLKFEVPLDAARLPDFRSFLGKELLSSFSPFALKSSHDSRFL